MRAGFYTTGTGSAAVAGAHFDSCWWEFPGSDMIKTTVSWTTATFTSCRFDGSNLGTNRHVFNNAGSTGCGVNLLTLINPFPVNLTGKFLNLEATDPVGPSDASFGDVVIIGGYSAFAGGFEGIQSETMSNQMMLLHGRDIAPSTVIANSVSGLKSRYMLLNQIASTKVDDGLGQSTSPKSHALPLVVRIMLGSSPRTTVRVKRQLVVRFPTGAVQVIATEP